MFLPLQSAVAAAHLETVAAQLKPVDQAAAVLTAVVVVRTLPAQVLPVKDMQVVQVLLDQAQVAEVVPVP